MAVGEEAHELCISLLWVEARDALAIAKLNDQTNGGGWNLKSIASALEVPGTMALMAKARTPWHCDQETGLTKGSGSGNCGTDLEPVCPTGNKTNAGGGDEPGEGGAEPGEGGAEPGGAEKEEGPFWVLADAGFIVGRLAADEAEIIDVVVLPSFRRRGIGRKLVEGLCRAVALAGAERIFLEVAEDNLPAHMLYQELGFEAVAKRERYYARAEADRVDAIVMKRDLPRPASTN